MREPARGSGPENGPLDPAGRPVGGGPRASSTARQMGELAGFGLTMGLATALFAWLGSLLDGRLHTKPLFVLVGAFVGFGAGFYSMYSRLVLRARPGSVPGSDERDEAAADDRD